MNLELQRVLSHFLAVDGKAVCPHCGKHSLSIDNGKKAAWTIHCFNCPDRQAELAKAALAVSRDINAPVRTPAKPPHIKKEWTETQLWNRLESSEQTLMTDKTAQHFLIARGIPLATAQAFRIGAGDYYFDHRLVIPYLDGEFAESLLQLRYRQVKVSQDRSKKWRCDKRSLGGRRLFNLSLLRSWDPNDCSPLVITEAELDCMMLTALGISACSVDTAGHRLVEEDLALLLQVKNLVLAFDQDEAGAKCTERFRKVLPKARVLSGYDKKDLGDLREAMGPQAFEQRIKRYLQGRENAR
jgi:Toprim-like